jgi:hypothetical protein
MPKEHANNETRSSLTIPTKAELEAAQRAGVRLSSKLIRENRAKAKAKVTTTAPVTRAAATATAKHNHKHKSTKQPDAELVAMRIELKRLELKAAANQ